MKTLTDYFGTDGLVHIIVSAIITATLAVWLPVWVAAVATLAIGVAKEIVWDYAMGRGTAEIKDIVADVVGILIGVI